MSSALSHARPTGVIARLVDAGAEGIVLGCTEIALLIGQEDSPVPVFDTTRLHVEAGVAMSLEPLTRTRPHTSAEPTTATAVRLDMW